MVDLQLAKNVSLLADTAWRHLSEDPLLLAVQASRRLPASARGRLAAAVGAGARDCTVRGALAEFLADRPGPARQALTSAQPRSGLGRRLAAELAVQLGVGLPPGGQSAVAVQARELWAQGDLSGAVAVLGDVPGARHQRARLRSEMAAMSPGFRLPLLSPSPEWAGAVAGGPPRVLHVLTNSFPHTQSGYAVRSHAVLRSSRQAGVEVRAVTRIGYPVTVGLVGASRREVVDGIEYRRLLPARLAPTPVARLVQMSRLLAREVEEFRPAVLHTTTNYQNALVVRAVAESYGLPWVYEMRGVLELTWVASRPLELQEQARASERFRRLRAKETEMALAADLVIALSQVQKADLVSRGVPAAKVWVVSNAVEDAVLEAERVRPAEARRRLGLPEEGTWAGSVSSLVPYEGFEVLLRAVARCRSRGLDVRCLLVGDGVSRASLVALAADLGLDEQVCVLPGRVSPGDSLDWYQALDVFCVPRLDTEVCRMVTPIKPLTAMGLGRPVIASDLPALVEVTLAADELRFPAGDFERLSQTIASWVENGPVQQDPAVVATWGEHGQTYAHLHEELR